MWCGWRCRRCASAGDDIPLLAGHFLEKYSREMGRRDPRLDAEALTQLTGYAWPGNIRELENMMERAAVLSQGDTISPTLLPDEVFSPVSAPISASGSVDFAPESLVMEPQVIQLEKRLIQEALNRTGDNKSAAARLLEISERSLWYKIKKYGLATTN